MSIFSKHINHDKARDLFIEAMVSMTSEMQVKDNKNMLKQLEEASPLVLKGIEPQLFSDNLMAVNLALFKKAWYLYLAHRYGWSDEIENEALEIIESAWEEAVTTKKYQDLFNEYDGSNSTWNMAITFFAHIFPLGKSNDKASNEDYNNVLKLFNEQFEDIVTMNYKVFVNHKLVS